MTNTNELILWQDRLDLLFSSKAWPQPIASKLASMIGCPNDLRANVMQAEIHLMLAAKAQRDAIEAVEQWVRQQRDKEIAK